MKVRFGLQAKFFVMYLVFGLVISFGMYMIVQNSYVSVIYENYYENAIGIGKLAAGILDGDKVTEYAVTLKEDEEYLQWKERLNNIKESMGTYYLYVMYPVTEEKVIYILEAEFTEEQRKKISASEGMLGEEVTSWNSFKAAKEVLQTGLPSQSIEVTTTVQVADVETLGSVYVPVFDSEQKVVAVIGVDVLMSDISAYIKNTTQWMVTSIVLFCLISFLIMLFIIRFSVVKPMKVLEKHAEEMENNIFGNQIAVRGSDEISEISRVFNRMNTSIGKHLKEVEVINNAYYKYVPSELFQMLGRNVVTDVKLEDYTDREMTVISYRISNFDEIAKQIDTKQIFRFINHILTQAVPIVTERKGIIEKFEESGFRAFYTESCEESLLSAIAVCDRMKNFYDTYSKEALEIVLLGFGISYGSVRLGIVGNDERMSVVSVAKYTIMADFLRSICRKYYASILITAEAAMKIDGFQEKYHSRFLGFVYNSYTRRVEKIYDVYDGDIESTKQAKNQTKQQFERGVELFCIRKFMEARTQFVSVLKQNHADAAAREYLYLCNQYYQMEEDSSVEIYIEKYE